MRKHESEGEKVTIEDGEIRSRNWGDGIEGGESRNGKVEKLP